MIECKIKAKSNHCHALGFALIELTLVLATILLFLFLTIQALDLGIRAANSERLTVKENHAR